MKCQSSPNTHSATVEWTLPMLKRFKKACAAARKERETNPAIRSTDTFTFEGNEYVVSYAEYLIKYLEVELR